MKKRLSLGFALVFVLLLIASCTMDQLSSFTEKMSTNVAGSYVNTSSANAVKDSATKAETTTVTKATSSNTATIILGSKEIKIDITNDVSSMLAGLSNADKDTLVSNVISATTNSDSKENLINTMKTAVGDKQKEAAQGTATVVSSVLKDALSAADSNVSETAKKALEQLQSSMDAIKTADTVSAGDVIALQLMTSLVEKVADSATTDTTTGKISGITMDDDKTNEIITDALKTVTVVKAISSATKVDLKDFTSILDSLKDDTTSRALGDDNKDIEFAGNFARAMYDTYKKMFPSGVSGGGEINMIALYRNAVEIYVNFNKESTTLDKDVCNLDGLIQYTMATLFAEANKQYAKAAADVFKEGTEYPTTLDDLIKLYIDINPFIADKTKTIEKIKNPENLEFKDSYSSGDDEKAFKDLLNPIIKNLTSSVTVFTRMIDQIGLSIGDMQKYIDQLPKFCDEGFDYEWTK